MIPAPCGTAEHPMRIMACLFLFYCILNFCMPFCVLGKLCRNIGMQGNVPVLRNEREGTESNGAVRKVCRCEPVTDVTGVAAPRLDGNSLVLRPRCLKIRGIATPACALVRNDRAFSNSSNILLRKKSILLTPRPWWRQCPRRFRRRWQAAHRRFPPGPWLPPASAPRRRQRSSPWGYPGRSCS